MTNSPYLDICMEELTTQMDSLAVALHLNFMEGQSLCSHTAIPLLTDDQNSFLMSFDKLLLGSFLPKRARLKQELKREIRAQIKALLPYLDGAPLRIDGHAHYHMIPAVFDALMEVITEDKLEVSYIVFPKSI